MANGRLGQTEAVARGSEAAKIPNCKKDTQQIKVKMVINPAHTKNYNYEFDLVQAGRHRTAMATHFNAASDMCVQISAGKLSIAEVLSEAIAQIENFDDTINAVVVGDFERAFGEAKAAETQPNERRQSRPSSWAASAGYFRPQLRA